MRVALVFLGRKGGGAAYSRLMANALANRCDVLSVVSSHADNLANWRASGQAVLEVPTYTTLPESALSILDLRRHLDLRRQIQAYSPDVIYYPMAHLWTPIINALLPRIPKVLTLHDPILHIGERSPILRILQRVSVRQSTRIIVLSRHSVPPTTALGVLQTSIDVVPHGEFSFYQRVGDEAGSSLARDGKTLLFFGRISRYKGIDVLLEAFQLIEERRPGTRLLLVGSGDLTPYSGRLRALQGVTVVNRWIADREVYSFFTQSVVVVLPYIDGSQSGVIPIAYACGLPVVASNVGGLPDQVVDGETGLLVPPGNAPRLANACIELLDSPPVRAAMGRKAAEKAMLEWSWESAAAKVLESLQAAAGTHGSRSRTSVRRARGS